MKNPVDYSKYECPYTHLEKECSHDLKGPEGYEEAYGVWCGCGYRGPVFYLDPKDLGLKEKGSVPEKIPKKVWMVANYDDAFVALFDHEEDAMKIVDSKDNFFVDSSGDRRRLHWYDVREVEIL